MTLKDLCGKPAFKEAKKLVMNCFDCAIWEEEIRKSGCLDVDSETEDSEYEDSEYEDSQ